MAGRALAPLLYPAHPYARPASGMVTSVGGLDRDQIARFHRAHYRPDATIVAVVGDVSASEVRAALLARLGRWRAPATPRASIPVAPSTAPPETRTLTRELTQTTVYLGWGWLDLRAVRRQVDAALETGFSRDMQRVLESLECRCRQLA